MAGKHTIRIGRIRATPPVAARGYDRGRDLPRLLPVTAMQIEVSTLDEHARLIALLRRALRGERCRGVAGHWTYDLARHAALLAAFAAERAEMASRLRAKRLSRCGSAEPAVVSGPVTRRQG